MVSSGASPFQRWEARPFPAIPYRPHTITVFLQIHPQITALGDEDRRCKKYLVKPA
jgi:hypothetical protein